MAPRNGAAAVALARRRRATPAADRASDRASGCAGVRKSDYARPGGRILCVTGLAWWQLSNKASPLKSTLGPGAAGQLVGAKSFARMGPSTNKTQ